MGESFFQRWARRKAEQKDGDIQSEEDGRGGNAQASVPRSAESTPASAAEPLPTLDDVARLTQESDYSPFVSKGIDQTIRRAALKKLFSDPHFNVMDGLDIYIDDYNKFQPLTPAMLAALSHTQSMFEAIAKKEAERAEMQDVPALDVYGDRPEQDALENSGEVQDIQNAKEQSVQTEEADPDDPGSYPAQGMEFRNETDNAQAARGTS
ncbi:DUF3306 domain-containing protein [Oxalobacteraceae bacterium R-40]|uniref:DUF3306 domain-containing protein n=1 Tax=Keguizhuia sedimenti TaxID=3064264 RepID=A0ABU1BL28_9BURK|nr:DUF3306 domain-containing protein [Oxalobacteraceae bacterium R-40]